MAANFPHPTQAAYPLAYPPAEPPGPWAATAQGANLSYWVPQRYGRCIRKAHPRERRSHSC